MYSVSIQLWKASDCNASAQGIDVALIALGQSSKFLLSILSRREINDTYRSVLFGGILPQQWLSATYSAGEQALPSTRRT